MESNGGGNGLKLRRGRISLERKREIIEQYDLLSNPCCDEETAAKFGVTKAALSKILSERDEIPEAPAIKIEKTVSLNVDDAEGGASNGPKLKRGRLSFAKQKELLALYDLLPKCSYSEAACKLGVREATLTKLLANRRAITSGERKRKKADVESSSDSDSSVSTSRVKSAGLRRGPISTERQKQLLEQYDELQKPITHQAAAAQLGVSQAALANLLASREASKARLSPQPGGSGLGQSPQPGSSGLKMALRKGRRVRVDYSEDEQSGSDYTGSDSDTTDDGGAEVDEAEREPKQTRTVKRYSLEEKQQLLAKYDELAPCPQWRAAQVLGITQSTLSNWLSRRAFASSNATARQSKRSTFNSEEDEDEDSNFSAEEIDSYVMGSTKGTQVVQFFEVSAEEHDRKSNDSNAFTRKPYMTLREKFELYKKYDSMDPDAQRNAAAAFNLCKSTWFNLITNRDYYEKRFKTRLAKDMVILNKYDELQNKRNAAKELNVPKPKLNNLLESRAVIEKYCAELFGCNENGEPIVPSVDETEVTTKESETLGALETELLHWFEQVKDDQVINWKVLKEKAKDLAAKCGLDDFYPPDEWLKKWIKTNKVFRSRKGRLLTVYEVEENPSVSECVLAALKDYPPENVFNLVETGLYYRAVPGYTPITNDWVTVAFACNMSGTEKKRLLVVGKSEAPLLFRVMHLPLAYKYSSSSCMTEEVFCDFLQDWDQQLEETDRTIAVILDSSHPKVQLSRIRLFFVPRECSAGQPLSDGVVGRAKALFRKRMAESLRSSRTARGNQNAAENITILDALFALAEAWENVPKSLLVAKFLKSTFPQNDTGEPEKDDLDDEELERLNDLDEEIHLHSTSDGLAEPEGDRVVHMEGTLHLSEEDEDDFDIDSLLRDQDTPDYKPSSSNFGQKSPPDLGSKLKNFLQKPAKPNGSDSADPKGCGPPTASDVRGALATIKKFLQLNGCTLEDLTDYTQLEIKVLSKIKNMSAASKVS